MLYLKEKGGKAFMDTKFRQMVQIGERKGDTIFYFEDYAYTYLKKHLDKEKLYLYGKIENNQEEKSLYIYGVSIASKLEKTYFKEYAALGYLRINDEEKVWIYGKEEKKMEGYYIFYSSNQAMQEYLIEQGKIEKEEEKENIKGYREELNIRERLNLRPLEENEYKRTRGNTGILFVGTLGIVLMVLFGLSSSNGQKKMEVFKEIIANEWMNQMSKSEEVVIEEKNIMEEVPIEENIEEVTEEIYETNVDMGEKTEKEAVVINSENIMDDEVSKTEPIPEEVKSALPSEEKSEKEGKAEEQKEYIVEKGDTLAWICKKFYGTTDRLKEISELNNISNMDHIAPGQKLYLPN